MDINTDAKILLDADVIIHFIKGGRIGTLPEIFPNKLYLLDIVFDEVFAKSSNRAEVENMITLGFFNELKLDDEGSEVKREYYWLTGTSGGNRGKGESAVMAYCRYHNDVLASSNLKDIKDYCKEHEIVYLTTMDFLAKAFRQLIMTENECDDFIKTVKAKGSHLMKGVDRIRDYRR